MEKIDMNGIKINNMKKADATKASTNQSEIKEEVKDTSKDTSKPCAEAEEKPTQSKHIVTYIGSSEFTDSTGYKWYKNDEQTYNDDEYAKRNDLHFMVKYGEMKHIVVTM